MIYKCEFPGCKYTTDNRNNIAEHHIIPISKVKNNNKYNKIYLCPTHHTYIYIPGCKHGIHSKYNENSIIILGKVMSSVGIIIKYKYVNKDEILFTQ